MVTYKIIAEWADLYQNKKMNCAEIARMYGATRDQVRYYLRQFGIKTSGNVSRPRKNWIYRKKYIICIYDIETDALAYQFENAKEMAEKLNKTPLSVYSKLNERRINRKFRINKKWYRIELLEVEKIE